MTDITPSTIQVITEVLAENGLKVQRIFKDRDAHQYRHKVCLSDNTTDKKTLRFILDIVEHQIAERNVPIIRANIHKQYGESLNMYTRNYFNCRAIVIDTARPGVTPPPKQI